MIPDVSQTALRVLDDIHDRASETLVTEEGKLTLDQVEPLRESEMGLLPELLFPIASQKPGPVHDTSSRPLIFTGRAWGYQAFSDSSYSAALLLPTNSQKVCASGDSIHDTALAPVGVLLSKVQLEPFQDKTTLAEGLAEGAYPTAIQKLEDVHDTLFRVALAPKELRVCAVHTVPL